MTNSRSFEPKILTTQTTSTSTTTQKTTTVNSFWNEWSATRPTDKFIDINADLFSIFNPNANNDLLPKNNTNELDATRDPLLTGNMDAWMIDVLEEEQSNSQNSIPASGGRYL